MIARPTARSFAFFAAAVAGTAGAASAMLVTTLAFEPVASADEVSPTGKGIVGGGLLGAEVVTGTESIIGLHNPWAFVIGGGAGAAGGAIAGYFVEQGSSDGRAPMYMLAGGLALLIPAAVLTLDATRFRPSDDATEDKAPTNGAPADPGKLGGSSVNGPTGPSVPAAPAATPEGAGGSGAPGVSAPSSAAPTTPAAPAPPPPPPTSMFHFEGGQLRIGVPVPEVRPMYTALEQKTLGVSGNATEMRMPLLRVRF